MTERWPRKVQYAQLAPVYVLLAAGHGPASSRPKGQCGSEAAMAGIRQVGRVRVECKVVWVRCKSQYCGIGREQGSHLVSISRLKRHYKRKTHLALVLSTLGDIHQGPGDAEHGGHQTWRAKVIRSAPFASFPEDWYPTERDQSLPWNGHSGLMSRSGLSRSKAGQRSGIRG